MSDSIRIWDEISRVYDGTRRFDGAAEEEVPRLAAGVLRERGARRVLDLGCGTGRFAIRFAEAGLGVVGVDRSAEMLARLAAKPRPAGLRIVRCDAAALPFARHAFDAVFTSHFLHLVPEIDDVADEVHRVLRPGGLLADADTTYTDRRATSIVIERVFPRLVPGWTRWPTGERSRMRDLFERVVARLGGGAIEVLPLAEWTSRRSLRSILGDVRERLWATIRVHPEDRVLAAADAAERDLVAEGHDLDEAREDREGVRLLVASPGSSARGDVLHFCT